MVVLDSYAVLWDLISFAEGFFFQLGLNCGLKTDFITRAFFILPLFVAVTGLLMLLQCIPWSSLYCVAS